MKKLIATVGLGLAALSLQSQANAADIRCNSIPSYVCTGTDAYCGELVPFTPKQGLGYHDYAINGETQNNQYRSYVRRDLMMLIKYATAKTYCISEGWPGNGGALGLGDMSEGNGAIPGTSIGSPGHPAGTHVNGRDMDIGYYQVGTVNNFLRPVCPNQIGGRFQYHCTGAPTNLDINRTALFIGLLHHSPQVRVIGVDGKVGPLVVQAIDELCLDGTLTGSACTNPKLAYEETNQNRGWFLHHHHHLHVSLSTVRTGFFAPAVTGFDGFFNANDQNIVPNR